MNKKKIKIPLPDLISIVLLLICLLNFSLVQHLSSSIVPLSVGIIFYITGVMLQQVHNRKKERCSYLTTGRIVSLKRGSGQHPSHYPVYSYSYGGEEFTVKSKVSDSRNQYKINQEVEVYLDPENPETSYLVFSDETIKLLSAIFRFIGIVWSIVATLATLINQRP